MTRRPSRYRVRRKARRMRRRYGAQPLIVLNDDDLDLSPIMVVVARGIWRYRSELAPLTVAALTLTAGLILHARNPHWWPHTLAATGLAAWALALFGAWWGLDRLIERLYAAAVVELTGDWLAAATALGPFHDPLPAIFGVGTLAAAIPWWTHRRRRARVKVTRQIEAWPQISEAAGLAGSRVQSAAVDLFGWNARLKLARGQTVADALTRVPALESALGTRPGAVRIEPAPERADRCQLRVVETDPHAQPIPWPGPSIHTITAPIELGMFEDATPAAVSLFCRHGLVAGIAGSGKSGLLNVILGNLVACPDVVLWGIDLKGGMELQPWASCLDRLATTPAQAGPLLRDVLAILDDRAAQQADHGERIWTPHPDAPALMVVIDEYAELPEQAMRYADSIARRGRAVSVTLLAATQRPSQDAMGEGAVRSQMDVRICFRVRERRDVDLILGQGMLRAGWHAHTLDAPGKFLISAPEHPTPRRARAYLIDDETVRATADQHTETRPTLPPYQAPSVRTPPEPLPDKPDSKHATDAEPAPEAILWAALTKAPDDGVPINDLIQATGRGRRWIYYRLRELARDGRAVQTVRGRWRASFPRAGGDAP